ncbi:pyridoxamine 5'-phosphate oxidase family protein [Halopelagius fulvigenes]|uniref:Pyridoxamine 5'-phosphate oxidase family protein n=1 Tax=Halopelagius fulvigenes TaxID=1198324 RepID=A0ABD5U2T4_9EURY
MDNVEFVYMVGMDEADVARRLEEGFAGVLSLANDGVAYGVPASYHYDGAENRLLVRLSDDGESSTVRFLGETEQASFLLHDVADEDGHSWSVIVCGSLRLLPDEMFTETEINDLFDPVSVFDEDVADVRIRVAELTPTQVSGRMTAPGQ